MQQLPYCSGGQRQSVLVIERVSRMNRTYIRDRDFRQQHSSTQIEDTVASSTDTGLTPPRHAPQPCLVHIANIGYSGDDLVVGMQLLCGLCACFYSFQRYKGKRSTDLRSCTSSAGFA